jgi:hypothetical protein
LGLLTSFGPHNHPKGRQFFKSIHKAAGQGIKPTSDSADLATLGSSVGLGFAENARMEQSHCQSLAPVPCILTCRLPDARLSRRLCLADFQPCWLLLSNPRQSKITLLLFNSGKRQGGCLYGSGLSSSPCSIESRQKSSFWLRAASLDSQCAVKGPGQQ